MHATWASLNERNGKKAEHFDLPPSRMILTKQCASKVSAVAAAAALTTSTLAEKQR